MKKELIIMKSRRKKKSKKIPVIPFVVGATVGVAAGLLLAKKPGDELREDIGENIEIIKDKAKDVYENKGEIIDNISRNIKKITKSEIKNFVNPKYYSKEYDENGKIVEVFSDSDDDVEEFVEKVKDKIDEI